MWKKGTLLTMLNCESHALTFTPKNLFLQNYKFLLFGDSLPPLTAILTADSMSSILLAISVALALSSLLVQEHKIVFVLVIPKNSFPFDPPDYRMVQSPTRI